MIGINQRGRRKGKEKRDIYPGEDIIILMLKTGKEGIR